MTTEKTPLKETSNDVISEEKTFYLKYYNLCTEPILILNSQVPF